MPFDTSQIWNTLDGRYCVARTLPENLLKWIRPKKSIKWMRASDEQSCAAGEMAKVIFIHFHSIICEHLRTSNSRRYGFASIRCFYALQILQFVSLLALICVIASIRVSLSAFAFNQSVPVTFCFHNSSSVVHVDRVALRIWKMSCRYT